MLALADVDAFLRRRLGADRFGDDPAGVWRSSARPVRRLGLALEPFDGLATWAATARLDALLLHRPWRLLPDALADDVGVLAYHHALEEALGLGFNPRLAERLGLADLAPLGERDGRPLGMTGRLAPRAFADVVAELETLFGGLEAVRPAAGEVVNAVAVVGAMRPALVDKAAARGAGLYLTGERRAPARAAVERTGIGVVAVGHARSERWALGELADVLRARFPRLVVHVADAPA